VFILDPTEDQKALLFATINGKQTRVSASVIYENFEVIEGRCPQKSAHEIARAMNSDRKSPWYRKLKMLGKRVGADETLSQGTFVKTLLDLISSKPDRDRDLINRKEVVPVDDRCVFNEYWRTEQDAVILRVLTNMFLAASEVWKEDWGTSILTKTTGFRGLMKSLPVLVPAGRDKKHLDKKFFEDVFTEAKKAMAKERATLTADDFQPGGVGEKRLTNFVTNAAKAI
jgi:DGQHR domain-containing protein